MKKILALTLIVFLSSCSVYMAATQDSRKDTESVVKGSPRALVLGKLGQPVSTEKTDKGVKKDYFSFNQGYSGGTKAVRAVGHGVMDVLTLGIWEVIGTPIEGVADGQEMNFEITYDKNDKVDKMKVFSDGELIKVVE